MLIALLNRFFGFWRYLAVVIVYLVYEIIAVLFLLLDILIVSFLKRSCRSSDSVWFKLYNFFLALAFSLQPLYASISSLCWACFSLAVTATFFTGFPTAPKKSISDFLLISITNTKAISIIITIAPTLPNKSKSHAGTPPMIPPPVRRVPSE